MINIVPCTSLSMLRMLYFLVQFMRIGVAITVWTDFFFCLITVGVAITMWTDFLFNHGQLFYRLICVMVRASIQVKNRTLGFPTP